MKRNLKATLMMSLFAAALSACGPQTQLPVQMMKQPVRIQAQQTVARTLLVRFHGQMNRARADEFNAKYGVHILQYLPNIDVYVVEIDTETGLRPEKVMVYLHNDPMVAHAEVNVSVQAKPVYADMNTMPVLK